MRLLVVFAVISTAIFLYYPQLDLEFSRLFFNEELGKFAYRDALGSLIIYHSVKVFTFLALGYSFFSLCENLRREYKPGLLPIFKNFKLFSKKQSIYILLIVIITPGVLVHNVMKPLWDRARPVNIIEFGGTKTYTPAFHFSDQGENSFPSGHSSMAFILLAFAFFLKSRKNIVNAYLAIFAYALIAALCRVWQGGHFISDVTVAALLSVLTVHLGYILMFGKEEYKKIACCNKANQQ